MPRRHRSRRRIGGGVWDDISNWGSSLWQKTKAATYGLTGSTYSPSSSYASQSNYSPSSSYASQQSNYSPSSGYSTPSSGYSTSQSGYDTYQQPMTSYTYGGRRSRKNTRRMKGGFKDNTVMTGLAADAAPFSGVTAKPHTLVGGKTRRRGRKSRKQRKH